MATEGTKALGFLYIAIEDEFTSLCVDRLLSVFLRFFFRQQTTQLAGNEPFNNMFVLKQPYIFCQHLFSLEYFTEKNI